MAFPVHDGRFPAIGNSFVEAKCKEHGKTQRAHSVPCGYIPHRFFELAGHRRLLDEVKSDVEGGLESAAGQNAGASPSIVDDADFSTEDVLDEPDVQWPDTDSEDESCRGLHMTFSCASSHCSDVPPLFSFEDLTPPPLSTAQQLDELCPTSNFMLQKAFTQGPRMLQEPMLSSSRGPCTFPAEPFIQSGLPSQGIVPQHQPKIFEDRDKWQHTNSQPVFTRGKLMSGTMPQEKSFSTTPVLPVPPPTVFSEVSWQNSHAQAATQQNFATTPVSQSSPMQRQQGSFGRSQNNQSVCFAMEWGEDPDNMSPSNYQTPTFESAMQQEPCYRATTADVSPSVTSVQAVSPTERLPVLLGNMRTPRHFQQTYKLKSPANSDTSAGVSTMAETAPSSPASSADGTQESFKRAQRRRAEDHRVPISVLLSRHQNQSESNTTLHSGSSLPARHSFTTVMIRNLPNTIMQSDLLKELDATGFAGVYDFCYMPTDFKSKSGKEFAFVNFSTPGHATAFMQAWQKRSFCSKVVDVSVAEIQGVEANMVKWSGQRWSRIKNPQLKPYFRSLAADETRKVPDN